MKEMGAWHLVVIQLVVLLSCVNSEIDLDSFIAAARCRASCLIKLQCWRGCVWGRGRLALALAPLCDTTDCGPGCQEACRFHSLSPSQVSPVPLEEVLSVNNTMVSWPPLPDPVVYVVMIGGSKLRRTLESSVSLPSTADPTTVRVLVVDWRGLVKVLAPVAESPVNQALYILHSLGMKESLVVQEVPTNSKNNSKLPLISSFISQILFQSKWRLKVVSVRSQPPLVFGVISWRRYHNQLLRADQMTSYLVTWSTDDGVIRGNLLTNTSTLTLSLVPHSWYRIQVILLNDRFPYIRSEPLLLNTQCNVFSKLTLHDSTSVYNLVTSMENYEKHYEMTIAVILSLAILLVAFLSWRYQKVIPDKKQLYEQTDRPQRGRSWCF